MRGTLVNVGAILLGTSLGLAVGRRLPVANYLPALAFAVLFAGVRRLFGW